MKKGLTSLYEVNCLLEFYIKNSLLYNFEEDILNVSDKDVNDLTEDDITYLMAFSDMIHDLNDIYDGEPSHICNFLHIKNTHYPFNNLTPVGYVRKSRNQIMSTMFFVRCLKVYLNHQLYLEHIE